MPPIRYAIWTAVSTKDQATDDKASLHVQEAECRRIAIAKGWVESTPPYIVRGASRTRWENLHNAENNVPELREMLNAAQAHQFDVLVVKDYDRFRDILDQVYRVLNDYHIQFYSLAQGLDPVPPETFDPYESDSQELLISFSQLRSRTEIRTTRRRYRAGMPNRVTTHGLPVIIPYGYRKPPGRETDRQAIPEPDPAITPHILAARDAFLAGQSTRQIADLLQSTGAPTPRSLGRWHMATIRAMLQNPFYAGQVRWGASKVHNDRRTGHKTRERGLDAITATGKHTPLWDPETHQRILDEFQRRKLRYSGRRTATLSGLLTCGQCGAPMWLNHRAPGDLDPNGITWRCSTRQPGHPAIKNNQVIQLTITQLKRALIEGLPANPAPQLTDQQTTQLQDLRARRQRIQDGYKDGIYTKAETITNLTPVNHAIAALEDLAREINTDAHAHHQRQQMLATLREHIDQLENIINGESLQTVNHALKQILSTIIIIDSNNASVKFR